MHRQSGRNAQDHELQTRAVSAVFWGGQDGDLPLFACTLGLPQPALFELLQWCYPDAGELMPLKNSVYECIRKMTPVEFDELTLLLRANSSVCPGDKQADWLARAIAAAYLGSQELWQDLGLSNEQELAVLMAGYFAPLASRKSQAMHWKTYLSTMLERP